MKRTKNRRLAGCVGLVSPNNALASKQFGVAFGINRRVANCRINRFVTHEALNQPQVCPSIYQVVTSAVTQGVRMNAPLISG
jgi:hypothetical protein